MDIKAIGSHIRHSANVVSNLDHAMVINGGDLPSIAICLVGNGDLSLPMADAVPYRPIVASLGAGVC